MSTIKQGTLDPKSHLYYAPRWVRERVGEDEGETEPGLNETPERVEELPRHVSPPLDDGLPDGVRRLLEPDGNLESMTKARRAARRSLILAIAALALSAAGVVAALLLLQSIGPPKGGQSILAAVASKLSISVPTAAFATTEPLPPPAAAPAPVKEPEAPAKQSPPPIQSAKIEPAEVQTPRAEAKPPAPQMQAPASEAPKVEAKPAPPAKVVDPAQIAALTKRADALISSGDLPSARLILQWLAEAHDGHAAYELGMTYDPAFIKRLGAIGLVPDLARATTWYERARDWGSPEASRRLQSLSAQASAAAVGN